jgi:hypothetical protein
MQADHRSVNGHPRRFLPAVCLGAARDFVIAPVAAVAVAPVGGPDPPAAPHQDADVKLEVEDLAPLLVEPFFAKHFLVITNGWAEYEAPLHQPPDAIFPLEQGVGLALAVEKSLHVVGEGKDRPAVLVDDAGAAVDSGGLGMTGVGLEHLRCIVGLELVVGMEQREKRRLDELDAAIPIPGDAERGGIAHVSEAIVPKASDDLVGAGIRARVIHHEQTKVPLGLALRAFERLSEKVRVPVVGNRESQLWPLRRNGRLPCERKFGIIWSKGRWSDSAKQAHTTRLQG